jgi:hypothetical protein
MKYIKKLYPLIFMVSVFLIFNKFLNCSHKQFCETFKESKFSGKVIKKYINKDQHLYETLVYLNSAERDSMTFNTDQSDFYSFVEVGDSIIKIEQSNEIRIDNKDTSFFINFNCY